MQVDEVRILNNLEILKEIEKDNEPVFTLKSCFSTLDDYMWGGFRAGELITVTGITKHGKTELCRTFTQNFVKQGEHPLWLSYEEPAREFLDKLEDKGRHLIFYMPSNLEIYNPDWCIEIILKATKETGSQVVFIDHLHYLIDVATLRRPDLAIGSLARRLKRLAIEEKLVIFLLCHLQKVKIEDVEDIDFSLIRDSSFITQESNTVLFMYRKVKSDGIKQVDETVLKLCFHRKSGCFNRLIPLQFKDYTFKEIEF